MCRVFRCYQGDYFFAVLWSAFTMKMSFKSSNLFVLLFKITLESHIGLGTFFLPRSPYFCVFVLDNVTQKIYQGYGAVSLNVSLLNRTIYTNVFLHTHNIITLFHKASCLNCYSVIIKYGVPLFLLTTCQWTPIA